MVRIALQHNDRQCVIYVDSKLGRGTPFAKLVAGCGHFSDRADGRELCYNCQMTKGIV